MEAKELEEFINVHNTMHFLLGEEGFVFRKFELDTSINFTAYLDASSRTDKMEMVYDKESGTLRVLIISKDDDYLYYMLKKCHRKGVTISSTKPSNGAYFFFRNFEKFKDFMLDDFEEFMMNYTMVV